MFYDAYVRPPKIIRKINNICTVTKMYKQLIQTDSNTDVPIQQDVLSYIADCVPDVIDRELVISRMTSGIDYLCYIIHTAIRGSSEQHLGRSICICCVHLHQQEVKQKYQSIS